MERECVVLVVYGEYFLEIFYPVQITKILWKPDAKFGNEWVSLYLTSSTVMLFFGNVKTYKAKLLSLGVENRSSSLNEPSERQLLFQITWEKHLFQTSVQVLN